MKSRSSTVNQPAHMGSISKMPAPMGTKSGYLELFIGPMFSGKTSELLKIYNRYKVCQMKILVINYIEDTRYSSTGLYTHDQTFIPCKFIEKLSDVNKLENEFIESEIILINEGQFFPDIVEWVKESIDVYNKCIYVCGLDSDFARNKFGSLIDLIPYCDKVTKLTAICVNCKNEDAIFTHRLSTEKQQKIIGSDSYISLCRYCYLSLN